MAGSDRKGVSNGEIDEPIVVPGPSHQSRPRRLAKRDAEPERRGRARERLVKVLHGLDEMGLPEDQVQPIRVFDRDRRELHRASSTCPSPGAYPSLSM